MDAASMTNLKNEIRIFESFRDSALEFGLSGAAMKLSEEILVRQTALAKLAEPRRAA